MPLTATGLRVAVLAPIAWRVPPRHYGPWEQFASTLAEGLVARGAAVTLFATADSQTAGRLVSVLPTGYEEAPDVDVKVWEGLHIEGVYRRAGSFDVIHNGFDFLPLTYSALVATPTVTTIHGLSSERILPVFEAHNDIGAYVAISDADRRPSLRYAATIHHGIDTDAFGLAPQRGEHLLFLGRIHPEKGTAEAIAVARRCQRRLLIAGIVADQAYFDREVAPHLDGDRVSYLGPVGPQQRTAVLGEAHALLHLIDFDEPFGYSVVEAMASGTPVITHPRGSMPEIVSEGRTGFLVRSSDAAVDAVDAAGHLDRRLIRQEAIARFGQERMVDRYLALYHQLLAGPHRPLR